MAESYTVLARRYRSQNFDELVGQEAISQTLKNAIATNRVAHAFLFTGTRGVGKTSAARILAKAINCPNSQNGQPCGTCDTCKSIARGEEMDVIEIDGASNNSVDQVRELRQSAGIRPSHSPYKIYIIDEVHMLSISAFNALLKTLEEPPSHVKFIFATTDIHKVPATIISRCQRFDFKNIPTAKIAEHLRSVVEQEGLQADKDALFRIARLGNGSMRDALSLLDRVLSLGEKHITEKILEELLGKPATAAIGELVSAMAVGDAAGTLQKSDALLREGMGVEQVLGDLIEFLRNVMISSVCGKDTDLMDVQAEMKPLMADLASKFDAATLVHAIALCEQTLRSLKATTMGRPLFDALMVRLALSEQFSSIRELLKAPGAGGAAASGSPAAAQKKNDIAPAEAIERVREEFVRPPVAAPAAAPPSVPPRRPSPPAMEHPPIMQVRPAEAEAPAAADAPPAEVPTELPAIWAAVCKNLSENKANSINTMLGSTARLESCDTSAGEGTLIIPANLKAYASDRIRERIELSFRAVLGRPIRLTLVPSEEPAPAGNGRSDAGSSAGTPYAPTNAPTGASAAARVPPELIDEVRNAPVVKTLTERLGGNVTLVELIDKTPEGG
jgi:DNA polymerase III subunit gamma/tau